MPLVDVLAAGVTDAAGAALASGTVTFYLSGSSTLQTVYQDTALTIPHTNPLTLNAAGQAEVYTNQNVRLLIANSAGTTVWDLDSATSRPSATDVLLGTATGEAGEDFTSTHVDGALATIQTSLGGTNSRYLSTRTGAVNRNVRNKLQEVLSVLDFGALGDGTTNDAAGIQAAIDAVPSGGGTVYFPGATYIVGSVLTALNRTGITFLGDGHGSIVRASGGTYTLFNLTGTSNAIKFQGLQLEGGGSATTTASIGVASASTTSNVIIKDCRFTGPSNGTGWNTGVSLAGTDGWVDTCWFSRIYRNTAGNTQGQGVLLTAAHRTRITNNYFTLADGASRVSRFGIHFVTTPTQCHVSGNYVLSAYRAGIRIEAATECLVANNIVRDSNDATDTDGHGFEVSTSTACTFSGNIAQGCESRGFEFSGDADSTISGNVATTNTDSGFFLTGSCVRTTMIGNNARANSAHGIVLDAAAGVVVTGNDSSGNTLHGMLINPTTTDSVISGNRVNTNLRHGIYVLADATNQPARLNISSNTVVSNSRDGIRLEGAINCLVSGNLATNNSQETTATYDQMVNVSFTGGLGGTGNSFIGNQCPANSTANLARAALNIEDDDAAATDVDDTRVFANYLVAGTSGGLRYPYTTGVGSRPTFRNNITNAVGTQPHDNLPTQTYAATATLTRPESGSTIIIDTAGASRTLTLPVIQASQTDGQVFSFMKLVAANTATITAGAGNTITFFAGAGAVTDTATTTAAAGSIAATQRGASITLVAIGTDWIATAQSRSWT